MKSAQYLSSDIISKISPLSLKARLLVEGLIVGMHKSPYHGFSVEFAEHRIYNPGDSTKDIDWKVFARTDRLYTKQSHFITYRISVINAFDMQHATKYRSRCDRL